MRIFNRFKNRSVKSKIRFSLDNNKLLKSCTIELFTIYERIGFLSESTQQQHYERMNE